MIKPLHVTLVSLFTIDGRITRGPGAPSRDIIEQLGPEGKTDLHRYRAEAGAIAPALLRRHASRTNTA